MGIDKRAVERMMGDLQKEFDKHTIRVPLQADASEVLPAPSTVNNYNGPTVVMSGDGAQAVAWNSGTVNQGQQNAIAPGYTELADLLTKVLASLDTFDLPQDEADLVRDEIESTLTEVTADEPNPSRIKRAVMLIKGALAPVGAGASRAASEESAQLAQKVIEQLGQVVS